MSGYETSALPDHQPPHGPRPCEATGKIRFPSEGSAKNARTNMYRMRKFKDGAGRLTPYRCSFCHEWHLGNLHR